MKRYSLFLFYTIFSILQSYAQVETRYYQEENIENVNSDFLRLNINTKVKKINVNTSVKKMPLFDLEKMRKEDTEMEGMDVPYRFGKGFDVYYTLSDGLWHDVDEGRVWTMTIESEGALSLNYIFENFYLPDGACLFIVNEDKTVVYGPVTSEVLVPKESTFLTDIIPGSSSTIFLFEPLAKINESTLTIKRVVHGYRGFDTNMANGLLKESNGCNIDVACYPEYEKESGGVALVLLSNGEEWCSGSLLMSTDLSFAPYFLTAFHCIDAPIANGSLSDSEKNSAENWMFKFYFKKTTCNGSSLAASYTYNKATFCSAWKNTDFALMKLNPSVSQNTNLTWLGWDSNGHTPLSGFGIHHPHGDVMKISIEENQFGTTSSLLGNYGWDVNFDDGIVEKGSSGSPIFNQNKHIVGQLYGGTTNNNPCYQTNGQYGKFNLSWTGGGSNDTRLSNWLDPLGTNQTTMDSFKPSEIFIFGKTVLCDTANYVINGLPSNYTISWSIANSNFTITPSGNQCLVTYTGTPQYSVANLTATILWNGTTIKALTKRIVMHGTDMMVYGQQLDEVTPFGTVQGFSFTIPASEEEPGLNRTQADKMRMLRNRAAARDSIVWMPQPVVFEESLRSMSDEPEYGITEINGEFDISLFSTRFDGMNISFSGAHAPLSYSTSNSSVLFRMPAASIVNDVNGYYDFELNATSPEGCHDFSLCFRVMPVDGQATGDAEVLFNLSGSSLEVCFDDHWGELSNGMFQNYPWTLNIYRVSSGTKVHNSVNTNDCKTVSTSGWNSGVYLLTVDCNGNHYTKMFYVS